MIGLPGFARITRSLPNGEYPFVRILPWVEESPAARRIECAMIPIRSLLKTARVRIEPGDGYVWVDDEAPAIVLVEKYYRLGNERDLYLDLLHELTHLRQLASGQDLWDESYRYVDRPTEIEGYAVAVEEGLRLGMSESEIIQHLSNPWMSVKDVLILRENVERFVTPPGA
jgi:hypothetical protein